MNQTQKQYGLNKKLSWRYKLYIQQNCRICCSKLCDKWVYNIASRGTQSNSVYVSVLKISIVLADSLSIAWANRFARIFFFLRERQLFARGKILYFATITDTNRDSTHRFQNADSFATFSLGLEFLNEAEKEKNNGKGGSASVPSRFTSLNNHFWYGCLFFASDLMHNSTGYVIKQLVHAFSCALSSYGARGKFGEHSRS